MTPRARLAGFRGEFLWELDIAERQLLAMAEAVPAEKYDWRPAPNVRSFSEVFVHIAAGNFMLLEGAGIPAPADLYTNVPQGEDHFWAIIRRNDDLEKTVREKAAVLDMLRQSLQAVRQSITDAGDEQLDRPLHFFGEQTTVRRIYVRLLAHSHEHMGQMIAYLRFNSIALPWPDWRPDR